MMVQENNADDLSQNFVWHARDVDIDAAKKDPNQVLPVDKDKAKDDGQLSKPTFEHLFLSMSSDAGTC